MKNQWLKPFLLTLLVLVAPLTAHYLYFVQAREAFLLDRSYAHLANTATRAEARVSAAFDVFKNNPGRPNELGVPLQIQCGNQDEDKGGAGESNAGDEKSPPSPAATDDPAASDDQAESDDGEQIINKERWASLDTVGSSERNQVRFSGTHNGESCSVDVPAKELIGDLNRDGQFYDVVILDGDSKVIYQRDAASGRIADGELPKHGDGGDTTGKSTVTDALLDMRATYQGRPFLLFRQPLAIGASNASSWQIVGLTEQSQFNRLKYHVSAGVIAVLAFVLLSLLFAGPFLKLWYLGRFEPLTRFDIFVQAGAGLGLVTVVTIALLAWESHVWLSAHFDRRLEGIGQDTKGNIEAEVGDALYTLDALERPMIRAYRSRFEAKEDAAFPADNRKCPHLAGEYSGKEPFGEAHWPVVLGDILARMPDRTERFRQMIMAYLMDQKGCQLVKWSSEERWTTPGQYGDREYFQHALPRQREPSGLYDYPPNGDMYYEQVIVSRTTGEREIVFSKPVSDASLQSACRRAAGEGDPCVRVVTAKLRSLESVLPNGYGLMLLDRDANILLRNDGDTSAEQNLASEIDVPERLRAIVRLGADRVADPAGTADTLDADAVHAHTLDANYNGTPHRFYVVPLDVGHLTLAAYYDRSLVVAPILEAAGVAATLWIVWASVLLTLFIALWIADDITERALRRWPAYLALSVVVLAIAIKLALDVPGKLILEAVGIPFLLLPLRFLTREERQRMTAPVRRTAAVLAIWLAVMLAATLPVTYFYRTAQEQILGAMSRFQTEAYHQATDRQTQEFRQWKYKVGLGDPRVDEPSWSGFRRVWKNQTFFVGDEQPGTTAAASDAAGCRISPIRILLQQLPDYSPRVVGLHAMYRTACAAPVPLDEFRPNPASELTLISYDFLIGSAYAFLILTAVAIWYLLVRTFGLRAENVVEVSSFAIPEAGQEARYIVYGVPGQLRKQQYFDVLPMASGQWIDLRDGTADLDSRLSDSADAVALDHFDANLNDIDVVRSRIDLLERLLRENRRVVLLFVNTDPLNFLTSTYDPKAEAGVLSRFATALARFKLSYYRPAQEADRRRSARSPDPWAILRRCLMPFRTVGWHEKLVREECRHPDLWQIRDNLLSEPELTKWSKAQIVQQVQSRANAIYQHMWDECTRLEKFTLIELARGNPINPNNWDAARRLKLRGYLRTDPFYRIASESLRQFVVRAEQVEDVESWRAESPGAWSQIKVPIIVLLIGGVIFVAVTQPDLFNSVFAFLAAGAATFPFIVSALSARLQRAAKGG